MKSILFQTTLAALALAACASGHAAVSVAVPQPPPAWQQPVRNIFRELIEINTVTATGDTARDVVTLIGSISDVKGPQSWIINFNAAMRLPVSFKFWKNLDPSGPPAFAGVKSPSTMTSRPACSR